MARRRRHPLFLPALVLVLLAAGAVGIFGWGWYGPGPLARDTSFVVADGSSLYGTAERLEQAGAISSAKSFRLRAKFFAADVPIKAGEFMLPAGASPRTILTILQGGDVIRRMVTVPEGMPSIMVWERLKAEKLLTGSIPVPPEGSVLPDSYDFARGESRASVLQRMQAGMGKVLDAAWAKRSPNTVVKSPEEALILASIVEKETGKPAERRLVAGLYSNRLKQGMPLQADPTIIYPITRGKPLGRRIRQSEIAAVNDYNTYTMTGLPKHPITNPGKASIEAVLDPAPTNALFMVADGTGGHVFAATIQEHNANVARWFAIRRQRGEMK
ncbi:MAG: endolytic transglycosylase MltG [Candidatus Andeanibacterium colombiense]|uniref:Endolytic murein transglycosylase n=1 Tax=Candidatus Andeanibacterium colombiense TaxID=3121345 RepID=A0AAJ5X6X6_9SPHN|nr:MAG: endolytic transglycosylase MltG [Sphingomonadaceae bacterium]